MMSKKVLPFVVLGIGVLLLLVAKSWGNEKSEPATKYEKILTTVADLLEQGHFSPKKLDDAFSKTVFNAFIDKMDPDKSILLAADVESLRKFENQIDNEMRTGKTELVPAIDKLFQLRMASAAKFYQEILLKPFDFSTPESVQLDGDKRLFAKTDAELKEFWRKRLKYMVLERYAEALDNREKYKDSAKFVVKADSTLERESRDRVRKIWDKNFDRFTKKFNYDEKFNLYVNTITESMDPHTQFFPPVEKRAFDEVMSGEFFGIGALLGEQDGIIKIVSLVTGSPAWKSGEVQPNDVVLKVAQGTGEPIDIAGFETTDAVKLIRGQKGTEVRLTLRKSDGSIKVVSLIREKIVQDETYARSAIVQKENKIGYIYLPEFYANFEDPNGARCAKDVAKEIVKLKNEQVDGIVMDLRYNGGGSLQDVIQMVGLFIESGPVVQVKDRDGEASVYRDQDKGLLYDGPLVVMINEFSASASEIFAAAIQDYGRGIIVGTPSYGKGTVQRNVGLDKNAGFFVQNSELGSLKLTLQKFYRINGGSTQLKGVTPDVILPDNFEFTKNREMDDPAALPWDEIAKASFTPWHNGSDIAILEKEFQQKVNNNATFQQIRSNASWLTAIAEKPSSLKLAEYRALQQKIRDMSKQSETLQAMKTPLKISYAPVDEERISKMDKDKADRYKAWLKDRTNDIYLNQSTDIILDIITKGRLVRN